MDENRRGKLEALHRWIMEKSAESPALRLDQLLEGRVYQSVDASRARRIDDDIVISLLKSDGEGIVARINPVAAAHLAKLLSELSTEILMGTIDERNPPDRTH